MIGELLDKIRDTEARAAKIILDAQNKASVIGTSAQIDIEKIKLAAQNEIAKTIRKPSAKSPHIPIQEEIAINIDKTKIDSAKKYVTEQFWLRCGKSGKGAV